MIGLHLSSDKQSIILRGEHFGIEVRRAYSIQKMRSQAFIWNAESQRSLGTLALVQPVALGLSRWEHEDPSFDFAMTPHTVWVLPQWWPTYPGVPRRTSTIILYLFMEPGPNRHIRRIWRAAQHYSDAVESAEDAKGEMTERDSDEQGDEEEEYDKSEIPDCPRELLGGAPCSSARSLVNIGENAVTISLGSHGLPILAQSFNHLGWIEEEEEEWESKVQRRLGKLRPVNLLSNFRRNRSSSSLSSSSSFSFISEPRRKRVLKLVTFPDPGVSPIQPNCKLNKPYSSFLQRHLPFSSGASSGLEFGSRGGSRGRQRKNSRKCTCTTLKPVTLDVPSSVLERVYHMFLDPAAGTITLATEDNELLVYQYGRLPLPSDSEDGDESSDEHKTEGECGGKAGEDECEVRSKGKEKMVDVFNESAEDEESSESLTENGDDLGVDVNDEVGRGKPSLSLPVVST